MKNIEKQIEISVCIINHIIWRWMLYFRQQCSKRRQKLDFPSKNNYITNTYWIELIFMTSTEKLLIWKYSSYLSYPISYSSYRSRIKTRSRTAPFLRSFGYLIKLSVIFWTCLSPSTSPLINFIRLGTLGCTNEW